MIILKAVVFSLLVPGTVAVLVPLLIANGTVAQDAILVLSGSLCLVCGILIYGWCAWSFAKFGLGTPSPADAPRRLVVKGLYRYSRNPMYLGILAIISGWSLVFGEPVLLLYELFVAACLHLFILFYEEPMLTNRFPEEYTAYRSAVNRWLPGHLFSKATF
jgi:protein-S-isoprenylcysteine O-methyltransferase Ste14